MKTGGGTVDARSEKRARASSGTMLNHKSRDLSANGQSNSKMIMAKQFYETMNSQASSGHPINTSIPR